MSEDLSTNRGVFDSVSSTGFVDRRPDSWLKTVDGSRSRAQQRADVRDGEGAWSEDLESSVFGETTWTLPGKHESGPKCGEWAPRRFCEAENAHINMGQHECGNRGCPKCWVTWARDRATFITAKLGARRHAAEQGEKRAIAASVSPPEGSVQTVQDVYGMIGEGYEIAKSKGVRGGVAILHCYRIKDAVQRDIEVAREHGNFEGGDWKFVREDRRHWRDLTYWSPHVHIVGWVGSNDVEQGRSEEDDGWVWKNFEHPETGRYSLKPFYIRQDDGYEDMARHTMYLLSHGTYQADEQKQCIRWFGSLYNGGWSPEDELTRTEWDTIQRRAEKALGGEIEDDDAEAPTCSHDDCEHPTHKIWKAPDYLEQRGNHLTEEGYNRINTAFLWAKGDLEPPPGLKHPRREAHAWDALNALL